MEFNEIFKQILKVEKIFNGMAFEKSAFREILFIF